MLLLLASGAAGYTSMLMAPANAPFVVSQLTGWTDLQPETHYSLVVRARNRLNNDQVPGTNSAVYGIGWKSNVLRLKISTVRSSFLSCIS